MTDSSDFAAQRQKEIDDANKNPRSANFTTPSGAQGVTNPKFAQYAERYPDLKADYNKNWKAKGVSLAEYGASHYSSYGKNEGRLLSGPAKKESSGPSSSGVTQTTTATPAPVQAPPEIAYEGPAPPDLSTFDPTPVGISTVEPLLSEVVTDGPRSEVVSNRVASLVDTNSFEEAVSFSKNLGKLIVITRGEKGSMAIKNEEVFEFGIKENLEIIDLTGAGDLFAAGFLHGYINSFSLKESLEKGTEMSSEIIQKIGARLS